MSGSLKPLSNTELSSLTSPPEPPFTLTSPRGELTCLQTLRFLPGKRLVVKARLDDKNVIAKCFFGPHGQRVWQREVDGIHGFLKSGIKTPELINCSCDGEYPVVITACLDPVISFEDIWKGELEESQRQHWLTQVTTALAAMHKAGVQQEDIHLDNMLVHNSQLFFIDGGGARTSRNSLHAKEALDNLALFQAVLYPKFDRYLEHVWQSYAGHAPENIQQLSVKDFAERVQQKRKWREKFIQKGLRNCTRFRVEKSWKRFVAIDREFDTQILQPLIQNPEQIIEQNNVIKRGRTNTVAIVTLDDGSKVLVKRYKSRKNILHRYLRCLTRSRARISWLNSLLLEMLGIVTPRPMVMIEERWGPVVFCSYVVNRFEPGQQALSWFTENASNPDAPKLAEKVAEILEVLKRSLVFHGDMKATNILLVDNQPMLIDLDAMKSYKDPAKFRQAGKVDRKRFNRNWEGHPEVQKLFEPYIQP